MSQPIKQHNFPNYNHENTILSETDIEERFTQLFQGQYLLVNLGNIPVGKPPWFDEERYEAGRQFVKNYRGGLFFAHLTSLTLLLYPPQVLKPLIFTGKSETPKKSYRRYISTAVHVMNWYRGDMWKADSRTRKSLQLVRQYHSDGATRLNSPEVRPLVDRVDISNCGKPLNGGKPLCPAIANDLRSLPDCPFSHLLNENYTNFTRTTTDQVPYFNQLDMSNTQFAFMGLVVLYPEKFGMARASAKELEGFIHLWRCLGWILGIDDRFNYCQLDNLQETRRWASCSVEKIVKPMLKTSLTAEYEHMSRAVVEGSRVYTGISYNTFYLFIAWVLGLKLPSLEKRVSPSNRAAFEKVASMIGFIGNLPFGNYILNASCYLTLKLIVDPPFFWPRRFRPPTVKGLKEFWIF